MLTASIHSSNKLLNAPYMDGYILAISLFYIGPGIECLWFYTIYNCLYHNMSCIHMKVFSQLTDTQSIWSNIITYMSISDFLMSISDFLCNTSVIRLVMLNIMSVQEASITYRCPGKNSQTFTPNTCRWLCSLSSGTSVCNIACLQINP